MKLVLDIGNTNVKSAVFSGEDLVEQKSVSLGDLGNVIDKMMSLHAPKYIIASSVSVTKEELSALIDDRAEWFMFDNTIDLPISVEYQSKNTLGSDRLAGLMGVFEKYPKKNVLVIDAGTCITYDLLTYDNRYFGGSISPGMEMRYNSLNKFTKNLPLLSPNLDVSLVGQTTADSMHSGVVKGITYEIDGVINAYRDRFGSLEIVFTGGDAKNFVAEVKNTTFADQNLILNGLNKILDYHYQKA